MSEVYTGKDMDRRYTGDEVDILYNVKRCIHAEECIHRLSQVFDARRRPWIIPGATPVEEAAEMIPHCPSGALHYESKDGQTVEAAPETNRITLWHNGPLQVAGNLRVEGAVVDVQGETRATLCRCGGSQNKPFCDNTHKTNGFEGTITQAMTAVPQEDGGQLRIRVAPNGPLLLEGRFTVYDEHGTAIFSGEKAALCRCGGSGKKPFCDGTHKTNGFAGE